MWKVGKLIWMFGWFRSSISSATYIGEDEGIGNGKQ